MNALTTQALTMTSLEIASLVESRHDNVKRSIEALVEKGVIQLPPSEEVENPQSRSNNSKATSYIFSGEKGKRDSIVVVAQLSPEFTARLVDRWQELEAAATLAVPTDPVLALAIQAALAADAAKQEIIKTNQRVSAIESAMKTDPIFALPTPPTLSPTQQKRLMINSCVTVTELGRRIGLSPNAMNLRLISSGYQTAQTARNGRLCYSLTQEGDEYGVERYASVHTDGRPNQILWHPTVLANI